MKILLLDNYDSFTFNLFHLIEKISDFEIQVIRNDEIKANECSRFDAIILSPGPGLPNQAGNMMDIIESWKKDKPILGVCLGHQALSISCGAILQNLPNVFHGVATPLYFDESDLLFNTFMQRSLVGRYHSWVIKEESLPSDISIIARDAEKNIMAIKHQVYPFYGVQFHPESILTTDGEIFLKNWLNIYFS